MITPRANRGKHWSYALHSTTSRTLALALSLCVACWLVSRAKAQDTPETLTLGVDERRRVTKNEPEQGAEGELSLPYSQVLRDTEPPYENLFRDLRVGGRNDEKIGAGEFTQDFRLFSGARLNVPLASRGIRPEDAELKLGRFYLDVRSLSGSLLYSDNIRLSEDDRESDVIGIVRLTVAALFQLTDNVRLSVQGAAIWLPFEGKVGIAGFGIDDPLFRFDTMPLAQAQFTYDLHLARWDIEFVDDFRAWHRRFGDGESFDLFDGETFDEEDRAGRYVFRDRRVFASNANIDRNDRLGEEFVQARNLVGVRASRLLPTVTRLDVGATHSDIWYYGDRLGRLPRRRDSAYVLLDSERETLRFKPFAQYRVFRYDYDDDWRQEARAGLRGPVTENLHLHGDVGYYTGPNNDRETYLTRVVLRHTINPLTYHQLQYNRGLTEPDDGLQESWYYLLRRILGPDLVGEFFARYAEFRDYRQLGLEGDELRTGVRLTYDLSRRTTLRLAGTYTRFDRENREFADYETWAARAEAFYRHTESVHSRLIYQYRNRQSERPGGDYWENLVIWTLTKFF